MLASVSLKRSPLSAISLVSGDAVRRWIVVAGCSPDILVRCLARFLARVVRRHVRVAWTARHATQIVLEMVVHVVVRVLLVLQLLELELLRINYAASVVAWAALFI